MGKTLLAFDLYGTLLSTGSIAKVLANYFDAEKTEILAALWRRYQIEYTFRLNSMKQYEDFEVVTRKSLMHTLAENKLEMSKEDVDKVMQAYDNLYTFEDVVPALQKLETMSDVECVVFSNGTRRMIDSSVNNSADLSGSSQVFKHLISVDHVRSFKPAPEVYKYLASCVGMSGSVASMWLISSNPFDIVGARSVGMKAAWVDRSGQGWQDRLGAEPSVVLHSLGEVVDLMRKSNVQESVSGAEPEVKQ